MKDYEKKYNTLEEEKKEKEIELNNEITLLQNENKERKAECNKYNNELADRKVEC